MVYNYGPDEANDVIVEDPMPAGLQYNGAATSQGGATFAANKMTAYLGTIPRQSSAAISLFSTVTNAGVINNVATVASNTVDSEPADNVATGTVAASVPDFTGAFRTLTQRCSIQRCNVRGTFDVGNIGQVNGSTTVRFYLSDDALFQPATDTPIATANAGSVRPGQSRPVRFSARLGANAAGKYVLGIVNPDGLQAEANMDNNTGVMIVP